MSNAPTEPSSGPAPIEHTLLDRGDIVNLLGRFRERLREDGRKLTVVQNRLIMKRVEAAGLTRAGAVRPERQIEKIAGVVAELIPMDETAVEEELRACRR